MPPSRASGDRGWTRRVPGSAVLLFFLLSAGTWTACLLAWEARQADLVVVLLALGAFVPIVSLAVRFWIRPVWALMVRDGPYDIAALLGSARSGPTWSPIAPEASGHPALFRGCAALFRIGDPACLVGVRRSAGEPSTTILVLPLSRDRESVDRVRASIETRIGATG